MLLRFSLDVEVPGGPDAPRHARRFLRESLVDRVPATVLDDALLLVTELVANGVRHGGAGADAALHLRVEGGGAGLRVEVVDPGRDGREVAPRRPDMAAGGGLGLHIVDRVASRWGVGDGPGTAVWFELD
jgi:anti-sigma regulatory factor (Ser/Thr protein kinase)